MSVANIEPFYEPRAGAEQDAASLDDHFTVQELRWSELEGKGRELPTDQPDWPVTDDEGN